MKNHRVLNCRESNEGRAGAPLSLGSEGIVIGASGTREIEGNRALAMSEHCFTAQGENLTQWIGLSVASANTFNPRRASAAAAGAHWLAPNRRQRPLLSKSFKLSRSRLSIIAGRLMKLREQSCWRESKRTAATCLPRLNHSACIATHCSESCANGECPKMVHQRINPLEMKSLRCQYEFGPACCCFSLLAERAHFKPECALCSSKVSRSRGVVQAIALHE